MVAICSEVEIHLGQDQAIQASNDGGALVVEYDINTANLHKRQPHEQKAWAHECFNVNIGLDHGE